jgi:hypothetical protein
VIAPNSASRWACCGAPVVSLTAHKCAVKAPLDAPPVRPAARKSTFSNAKPTTCDLGHNHPSKVEARVCRSVHEETTVGKVYRNVRLPLFALPPTETGIPYYLNVDFVVIVNSQIVRLVDAKTGRVSRDWRRGAAACEATYGLKVEERDA